MPLNGASLWLVALPRPFAFLAPRNFGLFRPCALSAGLRSRDGLPTAVAGGPVHLGTHFIAMLAYDVTLCHFRPQPPWHPCRGILGVASVRSARSLSAVVPEFCGAVVGVALMHFHRNAAYTCPAGRMDRRLHRGVIAHALSIRLRAPCGRRRPRPYGTMRHSPLRAHDRRLALNGHAAVKSPTERPVEPAQSHSRQSFAVAGVGLMVIATGSATT